MSNISKRRREGSRPKIKSMGDHNEFLKRITKTLYYGQLPSLPCLSLPVTEISCEMWSAAQRGRSLRRLHVDAAAGIARSACVSPCALVLAVLYLERLRAGNPDYLAATSPAELFLVSLMVGNKFLQDDGEDEEVLCSEWASSGGLELSQLNKLEVEFLNAIDWNVYVSEQSFESGLRWLERRVALRQASPRGFFTYSDLTAACDGALLQELASSVTTACLVAAVSYLSGLLTLVTSTLMLSQACLPALHHLAATTSVAIDTHITNNFQSAPFIYIPNATIDLMDVPEKLELPDKVKCCMKWLNYHDREAPQNRNWYDSVVIDWKAFEPWWSEMSMLNLLYQSSLVSPMQRWLERINEYAGLYNRDQLIEPPKRIEQCHNYLKPNEQQRCVRQWLNFSKLSSLMVSMSDR